MEFFGLIGVLLLVSAVLGGVAFVQLQGLKTQVTELRDQLALMALNGADGGEKSSPVSHSAPSSTSTFKPEPPPTPVSDFDFELDLSDPAPVKSQPQTSQPLPQLARAAVSSSSSDSPSSNWFAHLQQNWMVWLGGFCVAMAGVFLAKYSIEQGMLGPKARIASGLITGVALHITALWLRHKNAAGHPSFAALAGGGSITLFASLLAALHLYQMFSPITTFALMAAVAVATMWLALLHGPVLAAIGMLGAYVVPVLVSSGSGKVLAAMAYSLVISASVLFLLRHVYRRWLWMGLLSGGLFWWAVSLTSAQADGWRGLYLALFAYGLLAVVAKDWLLLRRVAVEKLWPFSLHSKVADPIERVLPISLAILVFAHCVSMLDQGFTAQAFISWSALPVLLLVAAQRREQLTVLPWLIMLGQLCVWLMVQLDVSRGQFYLRELPAAVQSDFFIYLALNAALFTLLALRNYSFGKHLHWWASLATMAPILALIVASLLGAGYTNIWQWGLNAFVIAAIYIWLGFVGDKRQWHSQLNLWLLLGGHLGYALAAALILEEASLTLAIALQLVSLAWNIQRFNAPELAWLLKLVVVGLVVRLTLNPWLASYPADVHWSLWTYGGTTLACVVAARILQGRSAIASWCEVAALHLFVLTLWAETRYWLYDGATYIDSYSFAEAVVNSLLFSALGLVYYFKSLASESLQRWYQGYGRLMMVFALINYGAVLLSTLGSRYWAWSYIGETPLINFALLAYGMPVVMGYLVWRYYDQQFRALAALFCALSGFAFVSLEIHHLWTGSMRFHAAIQSGELYTYSIVWLVMALCSILGGSWRWGKRCYQGGMALLALVILKLFLVDLSDLEGLFRVASFMGLGLALLGVAFLHQKFQSQAKVD